MFITENASDARLIRLPCLFGRNVLSRSCYNFLACNDFSREFWLRAL